MFQEQLYAGDDVEEDDNGSPEDDNQHFDNDEEGASPSGQHEEYFGYQNDPGSDEDDEVKPAFVRRRINPGHASDEGSYSHFKSLER